MILQLSKYSHMIAVVVLLSLFHCVRFHLECNIQCD